MVLVVTIPELVVVVVVVDTVVSASAGKQPMDSADANPAAIARARNEIRFEVVVMDCNPS
jgi:hypothetical protein